MIWESKLKPPMSLATPTTTPTTPPKKINKLEESYLRTFKLFSDIVSWLRHVTRHTSNKCESQKMYSSTLGNSAIRLKIAN